MIISKTPMRLSFVGGGSDLPSYYRENPGAVLSTSIDKFVYVTINKRFEPGIRLSYSKTEEVLAVEEIEHRIVKATLRKLGIEGGVEITSVADIPSRGSGLGSSSSFTVGLLHALYAYLGRYKPKAELGQEACEVEIDLCGEPIGKQDQYAAAFGGLNYFRFNPGGAVTVEPLRPRQGALTALFDNMLMFWTGHQRSAGSVLKEQKDNTAAKEDSLRRMRDHALELHDLMSNGSIDPAEVGRILDHGWQLKRELASTISNSSIDDWYQSALDAGASGGKLCGAGGGGCILIVAPPNRHDAVRDALDDLTEVPVSYEVYGSRVLLPVGD
jgi:D-glycero-alpha-D-manno-heptose-7-phosphate kinase